MRSKEAVAAGVASHDKFLFRVIIKHTLSSSLFLSLSPSRATHSEELQQDKAPHFIDEMK
jgi:hypothetical protein